MFDVSKQLAVQSWCFRSFKSTPALIEQVKALGLSRLELCGVHANFNDPEASAKVGAELKAAGIEVTSIGVQYFGRPGGHEENWFKSAKALGCSMISASFDLGAMPEVLPRTVGLAEKYGINLGIHNHGGYDWLGSQRMVSHLLKNNGPRLGICIDSAWMMQCGEDPVKFAGEWRDRLYGVHIKDFTFASTGKWSDVIVGTGNLKLKEFLAAARSAPMCWCVTLEYEGDVESPGAKLAECVEKIRAAS